VFLDGINTEDQGDERMKTIQDVKNQFHAELQQWFRKQCENPWDRYHLYYLESSPGHDGGLLICKDPPENPEYKLATPEEILRNLTIDQNMVHFHSVLMRLPILSVE
jgi:hypothetical protein